MHGPVIHFLLINLTDGDGHGSEGDSDDTDVARQRRALHSIASRAA
jgi:hypothetical protein